MPVEREMISAPPKIERATERTREGFFGVLVVVEVVVRASRERSGRARESGGVGAEP
jgi:hypothetical protein